MSSPIVTLTTDFGLRDSFVGAVKGVLLSRCPGVQIVDLCHDVPPQDVRIGAQRLASAAPYFPPDTVHLAVVDPGVGGERLGVALRGGRHYFVGPDNGLLSLAAPAGTPGWHAIHLTNPAFWLPTISNTFHGRDVFAPVAAYLANGGALADLGGQVSSIQTLPPDRPVPSGGVLRGHVRDVDRFGNLITNVGAADLADVIVTEVRIGGTAIGRISTWYDPAFPLVAVVDGDRLLEIAAPGRNAAEILGVGVGAPVEVRLRADPTS